MILDNQKINKIVFVILLFVMSKAYALKDLSGKKYLCKGKYQTFGYDFVDSVNVIRHAGSFSENDYYKNYGTYSMNNEIINLDIEGDLFPRNINNDTLELFIGVHLNNTLVCICEYFEGDFNDYFKIIIFNESLL